MSEQPMPDSSKPLPPPPADVTDVDQIAGGEDRWANCPLRDCKRKPELLYEDFYLRGIRSNRLMCSACAVRVEMGYMAREEVKKADDRFFQGTQFDNLITFGIMFGGSLIINAIMMAVGFWYFAFFVGGGVGAALASFARRRVGGRATRQMPYFAIGGIILGAILAPTVYFFGTFNIFLFAPQRAFTNLSVIITSVTMGSAAWGIFLRRI